MISAGRVAAFVTFAVAVATDRIDGDLARRRGLITDFGKIADPIADKALIGAALVSLSALGELPWWVTVVVLAREIGVTVLRFVVIRHGVMPASRGGKAKTVLQSVAIGLYVLPLSGAGDAVAVGGDGTGRAWSRSSPGWTTSCARPGCGDERHAALRGRVRRTRPNSNRRPRGRRSAEVRVAVVAVGDELLSGDVADTATSQVARALAEHGIRLVGALLCADAEDEITDALAAVTDGPMPWC